jgi:hypothetical protein
MEICVASLSLGRPHNCSPECIPVARLYHRMHNALQSLANCAYLLARDSGVAPENAPLLAQMQADVATVSVLLRRVEPSQELLTSSELIPTTGREI